MEQGASYHWKTCSGCEETRNKAEHDWNYGTDAVVDEIVEAYCVKVQDKSETFIVTCYPLDTIMPTYVFDKENLKEPKMHKVEATKDKVIIEHFT